MRSDNHKERRESKKLYQGPQDSMASVLDFRFEFLTERRPWLMSEILPRLRTGLDVLPSPIQDRPGIVLRDPFRYCEDTLLIPATWVPLLSCLDGKHTELDLQVEMVRHGGGELVFSSDVRQFVSLLRSRGFLETEEFLSLQETRHEEFRACRERDPAHAGTAYPGGADSIKDIFDQHFGPEESSRECISQVYWATLPDPETSAVLLSMFWPR